MASKDYIVDVGKSEVTFKGQLVARYNPLKREEVQYEGDGKKRSRWVKAAIKGAPKEFEVRPESKDDGEDGGVTFEEIEMIVTRERSFADTFPMAPKPFNNIFNYKHEEIYRWFCKHYPDYEMHLYPKGFCTLEAAGLIGNATIRPIDKVPTTTLN